MQDDKAVLVRLPELNFIDDKEGKPIGINMHIGHRPIAAAITFGGQDVELQYILSHFSTLYLLLIDPYGM